MARRRNRKHPASRIKTRVAPVNASAKALRFVPPPRHRPRRPRRIFRPDLAADRRNWRPSVTTPTPRGPVTFLVGTPAKQSRAPNPLHRERVFFHSKRVLICVRRHARREVLLAKGKGGKNRRGKRNAWSNVHCKR